MERDALAEGFGMMLAKRAAAADDAVCAIS